MKTFQILSRVATFLIAALWSGKASADIMIYITPGNGLNSVFQISGTFDAPISTTEGSNLSAFSFMPPSASIGNDGLSFLFSSPPATIVNTTRGISANIWEYNYESPYQWLWVSGAGTLFPVTAGDDWTLTSHGPVTCPVPFADFVPGNYVYSLSLGSTTIYTYIIPEPSSPALAGVGSILILLYRAKRVKP